MENNNKMTTVQVKRKMDKMAKQRTPTKVKIQTNKNKNSSPNKMKNNSKKFLTSILPGKRNK